MEVPFLDLKAQYKTIEIEIEEAVQSVINDTAFCGGPYVEQFEREFAEFCQCKYAIGVGSGTDALWLIMQAFGIGIADEVITVPNTYFATAEAISFCGAMPVFIDINEKTYTMNPTLLEEAITANTKAIIPVHLFGQICDMDPIMEIAERHSLYVIEDACQAHGAEYKGRTAGSIGHAGAFSFYPGKNLGAYGEAGAVVTNSTEISEKIKMLRNHGQSEKYYHDLIGWNARMDGIQGAVLNVKLRYLNEWNDCRRKIAETYNEKLNDIDDIITPEEAVNNKHVYHVYVIRTPNRDSLISSLKKANIHCGIHYPVPIHLQKAYRHLGLEKNSFNVTEKCVKEYISLPIYPELSSEQTNYIIGEVIKHIKE